MPGENASLPAKWFAALIKALRPTVENNKSGYCWPYCDGSDGNCSVVVAVTMVIGYCYHGYWLLLPWLLVTVTMVIVFCYRW